MLSRNAKEAPALAVITIPHKPELTKEQAQELFAKHFAGKYKVEDFKGPFRDFMVVSNPFTGVAIKLEQGDNETKFVYAGLAPRWWARVLLGGLIGFLFWNRITNEVEEYMRTAPEFK
jgi:hypothetical protein